MIERALAPRRLAKLFALALAVAAPLSITGGDNPTALILLSMRIRPYEALAAKLASLLPGYKTKVESLDEDPSAAQNLSAHSPSCIFTVGQDALNRALPHRDDIPLYFTMVLSPPSGSGQPPAKLEGVAMIPSPKRQLSILRSAFNMKKTILFYNPEASGFLASLYGASCPGGMTCDEVAVENEKQLLEWLKKGLEGYDGIILIPDQALLTEEGIKALVAASYEERVPMVAFSSLYLNMGAAVSISLPVDEIARQAAALAGGQDAAGQLADGILYPETCEVVVNAKAERRVKLSVNEEKLKQYGGEREGTP